MPSERDFDVVDPKPLAEFFMLELEVPAGEPDAVDPLGISALELEVPSVEFDSSDPVDSGILG